MSRAEYMRQYRAKRKQSTTLTGDLSDPFGEELMRRRIVQLEEEVRHLKAELAKRPPVKTVTGAFGYGGGSFNSQPFRGPIPKVRKP